MLWSDFLIVVMIMSQPNIFCCLYNNKFRAEYRFDLQATTKKGYWQIFCIFPATLVPSACLPTSTIFWEKLCLILEKEIFWVK